MINTSTEYKKQVLKDGNQWKVLSEVTYSDGTNATLTNADIMENGLSFTDATSQKNKFCVGSFVSKMITLKVCNFENKFNPEKFESAKIHLQLELFLDDTQSWETLDFGTFYVDKHPCSGGIITLTAYNNAVKFEKKYDSTLTYPATLAEILQDACTNCGVILYSVTFPNSTYKVTNRPADDATTYADVVSYVAQLAGCFAKFNADGALVLDWYDTDRFYQDTGDILSGGDFSDYSQEDIISGGDFTDYDQPDTVFGGVFRQDLPAPAQISSLTNYEVASKDICITGVQIVPADSNKPIVKRGREGYVVSIEKNPLAQDNLDSLIDFLAKRLIGFTFRPMSATGWDDPSFEAGDVAVLTDPYGNKYQTIISNLQYEFGNYESFSADAETESENRSVNFDSGAKAVQEAKEETKRQISRYDQAVGSFASMAALAMGLYSTKEQLDDGSYILYWHDKPNLADSQTIWKLTQNVFTVSDDGGKTWRGMDKSGNVLAKVLTAIGVVADWIICGGSGINGKFTVKDASDNDMLILDNRGITMKNGAKLIGGNGVLSMFISESSGDYWCNGYSDIGYVDWENGGTTRPLHHTVYVPENFHIVSAIAVVEIMSMHILVDSSDPAPLVPEGWYTASNVQLLASTDTANMYLEGYWGSDVYDIPIDSEPVSEFGAWNPPAGPTLQKKQVDVSKYLIPGKETMFTVTAGKTPRDPSMPMDQGLAKLRVIIIGYNS